MKLSITALGLAAVAASWVSWPSVAAAEGPDGAALYQTNCKMCHGAEGVPSPAMAKSLKVPTFADPAVLDGVSEDSAVSVIEKGSGAMKGFNGKLTREQEVALTRYIRTFAKKAKQ